MRSFSTAERRARLARRHFLSRPTGSVADAAQTFLGLHATDPTTPYLSLWARGALRDIGTVAVDLDERVEVRLLPHGRSVNAITVSRRGKPFTRDAQSHL